MGQRPVPSPSGRGLVRGRAPERFIKYTARTLRRQARSAPMTLPPRMKFGIFLAPFHQLGEDPTLSLERDLELLQWLDYLGFDEAWVGEHHSGGWEIIASPEVFIGVAAERTKHIKLGTGV